MSAPAARTGEDLLCPLCRGALGEDAAEPAARCEACGTGYHASCAHELGGCATLGCSRRGRSLAVAGDPPADPADSPERLVALAMDPDAPWADRVGAARRAGAAGIPALAKLVPESRFSLAGLRRTQLVLVRHADHPLASDALAALLRGAGWLERRALLDALGAPEQASLLPAIAAVGLESSPIGQLAAIGAAERVGHPAAAPLLRALEQRGAGVVRERARRALTRVVAAGASTSTTGDVDALEAAVRRAVDASPPQLPPANRPWELAAAPPRPLGPAIVATHLLGAATQVGFLILASWFGAMLTLHPDAPVAAGWCWFAITAVAWAFGLHLAARELRLLRSTVFTTAEVLGVTRQVVRSRSRTGGSTQVFVDYDVRYVVPDGRVQRSRASRAEEQPSLAKGDVVDVAFDPAVPARVRWATSFGPLVVRADGALTTSWPEVGWRVLVPALTLGLVALVVARSSST